MNYRTNRKYLSDEEIMKKYLEEANKDSNLPTAAIVSGNRSEERRVGKEC